METKENSLKLILKENAKARDENENYMIDAKVSLLEKLSGIEKSF